MQSSPLSRRDPAAPAPSAPGLTRGELARYARHLALPEIGLEGQARLKAASVLCIGAGGLGSSAALYLAAAGVGRLGLVDADTVDASNLQRQVLHGTRDVGRKKLLSARDRLHDVNPHVELDLHDTFFRAGNAMEIARGYDVVVDGTDNFPTRYLSNDVCVFLKKPNVYGSILRFEGQCSVFAPHLGGPCYRCMLPEPPPPGSVPGCAEGGVLGVLPGLVGVWQALEALKLIAGVGEPLVGRLAHFDALRFKFREFKLRRDPQCPVCGEHPSITAPVDYDQFCLGAGNAAPSAGNGEIPSFSVAELKRKLDAGEPFDLVDVREPFEWEICSIPGARRIPLGEIPARLAELDRAREIALLCKSGVRSVKALRILREAGFSRLWNVEGGISAWAREVDSGMARY
ncbi:MAG: molybdopterin-synthase adenylyltransferase MoeB [Chthoniobacteraceae bacterium]|nr:molybdopterin-synthase adenylyltransferase MoeB [Chthoniobacteraceae bacterium]